VTVDSVAREGIVDHVCRWGSEPLPFQDESFDLVYAAHVLEHIPWHQTVDALREAARVLTPGGHIELHVPDFDVLVRAARSQACFDDFAERGLNDRLHWMHWVAERMFHLGPEEQWHRACFNEDHLAWCLREAGFSRISQCPTERGPDHGVVNLGLTAVKSTETNLSDPADGKFSIPSSNRHDEKSIAMMAPIDARAIDINPGIVPGAEGLEPCHSRREYNAEARVFFCAHPNVHLAGQLATAEICRRCTRWQEPAPDEFRPFNNYAGVVRRGPCWHLGNYIGLRECTSCRGNVHVKVFDCLHPDHESTIIDDCLRCPDYEQRLRVTPITKWAVGVTTAPRRMPTLGRTLASVRSAGWSNIRLFAEPGSPLPPSTTSTAMAVTRRESTLGAWPNWFLGLAELYQRDPLADAYLMVQDDVLFCVNLRQFLETSLWPGDRLAVVSLYNPLSPKATMDLAGYLPFPGGGLPGALALVFPNFAVRMLLSDQRVLLHCRRGPSHALKLIDVVVGEWAQRNQLLAWSYSPSLAQHVGDTSSIWPESEDRVTRQSASFVGETFDATVLPRRIVGSPAGMIETAQV
jgi:hypothetical protein